MPDKVCNENYTELIEEICKRVNTSKSNLYMTENALQLFFHNNFRKAREYCEMEMEELSLNKQKEEISSAACKHTLQGVLEEAIKEFYRWEDRQITRERLRTLSQNVCCSTKSTFDALQTAPVLTWIEILNNKCFSDTLSNTNTNSSERSCTPMLEKEEEEEFQLDTTNLYEKTSNQLQCLRYRHFLHSQLKSKLQNLLVEFAYDDAARSRRRSFELPLLAEDAIKYSMFLTQIMTNNTEYADINNNNTNSTVMKESATSPIIFNKKGFALPYMQAPPPLLRSSSFATETIRLLKWLSTWDRAQQKEHRTRRKNIVKHKTKRNHTIRYTRKAVPPEMESSHNTCDTDVAHNAYINYRRQWLDAMKEGLPAMQATSPLLRSISPIYVPSPCACSNTEQTITEDGKHEQESDTNNVTTSTEEQNLPKSTNDINKKGNAKLLRSMPFHEEVEKENGLLGSSNIVYYDAFGNRLRSVRQARQQAEKLFATLANKEKMSKQKGYFQQDEVEKIKTELSSNPLLSACVQSSYSSRKRPRVHSKKYRGKCHNRSRSSSLSSSASSCSSSSTSTSEEEEEQEEEESWEQKEEDQELLVKKTTSKYNQLHSSDRVSQSSNDTNNNIDTNTSTSENSSETDEEDSREECTDDNDTAFITNIAVIGGPTGVGKTAAVYLAAELLQYRVVEMNASTLRCPRNVERLLAELTQSHCFSSFQSGRNVVEIEHEFTKLKAKQQEEEQEGLDSSSSSPFASTPLAAKHSARSAHKEKSKSSSEELYRKRRKTQSSNNKPRKATDTMKKGKRNGISLNAVNAFFGITSVQEEALQENESNSVCNENTFLEYGSNGKYITKRNVNVNHKSTDHHNDNITLCQGSTYITNFELDENKPNNESKSVTELIDLEIEEEEQEQVQKKEHEHGLSTEVESFDVSPTCSSPEVKCESFLEDNVQLKLQDSSSSSSSSSQSNKKAAKEQKQKTLLLIEDADVMLGDEVAKVFYNSLRKLATSSRIPIIISVTSQEPERVQNTISITEEEMLIATTTFDDELFIDSVHDKSKHVFQTFSSADNCQHVRFDKTAVKQFFGEQTPFTEITPLSNVGLFTELLTIAVVHANVLECNAIKSANCLKFQEEIRQPENRCKHSKKKQINKKRTNQKRSCECEWSTSSSSASQKACNSNFVKCETHERQEECKQEEEEWPSSALIKNTQQQNCLQSITLDESKVQVIEQIALNLLTSIFCNKGQLVCNDVRCWLNQLALHELHTIYDCESHECMREATKSNYLFDRADRSTCVVESELSTTIHEAHDAFSSSHWDAQYGRFVKCAVANKLNCPRQRLWEYDSGVLQYSDDVYAEVNAENALLWQCVEYPNKGNKVKTPQRREKEASMFEFMCKTIRESENLTTTNNEKEQWCSSTIIVEDESNNKERAIVDLCDDNTPSSISTTNDAKGNSSYRSPFDNNLSSKNNSPASPKEMNNCKDLLRKLEYALELNKVFTPLPVHLVSTIEFDSHSHLCGDARWFYKTKQAGIDSVSAQHLTTREEEKENNVRLACKRQKDIQYLYKNYIVGRGCSAYEDVTGFTHFFTH